ncbi:efflux RND transporter periplasmic adaptor subunit [Kordiimonas sp. SCSIO 12610]|uniref:efflux RND transporter periplasmic adaptor subunit n=1 Tax=Kordiimonas sp. SCSIO 12610 TaxID=2829597 RepID=UPI00210DCAAB|nr:efflux RND transporter periplasmic adaptor subunit [Kordiimonas sp. SCSIO 12610]UTW54696.1 efflux RND transporter periplasmic adaptor subunit [Kordiimonas sp. SCSIO 12610]
MSIFKNKFFIICTIVTVGIVGWLSLSERAVNPAVDATFEMSAIDKGVIRSVVSASGPVRPIVTVDIGSQLSGQIAELYVDYNDETKEGDLIARIDPQTFATRVRQAEADLRVAEAGVALQKASILRVKANLGLAEREVERQRSLAARGNASASVLDNAETTLATTKADLVIAEAQLKNANALVEQRLASLEQTRIDLERTEIRSPINGVVIERSVDVGQTVAASFSAPILFQIAQDLSEVQVEASIDEADIGGIAVGNSVMFTVDAYPNREFAGRVEQVRLAPVELNNVVTYTVIINASNPGRRLLPGMTANVELITGEKNDVLRVPNRALRFRPRGIETASDGGRPQGGPRRGAGGAGANRGAEQLRQLTEQLDLTQEQQDKVQEGFQAMRQRIRGMFQSAVAGGQVDRNAIRERIQGETLRVMKDILTPEQLAKYMQIQRERSNIRTATVWIMGEDGMPKQKNVRLGIDDGQYSEVISGLDEGDKVITRQNNQTNAGG